MNIELTGDADTIIVSNRDHEQRNKLMMTTPKKFTLRSFFVRVQPDGSLMVYNFDSTKTLKAEIDGKVISLKDRRVRIFQK